MLYCFHFRDWIKLLCYKLIFRHLSRCGVPLFCCLYFFVFCFHLAWYTSTSFSSSFRHKLLLVKSYHNHSNSTWSVFQDGGGNNIRYTLHFFFWCLFWPAPSNIFWTKYHFFWNKILIFRDEIVILSNCEIWISLLVHNQISF